MTPTDALTDTAAESPLPLIEARDVRKTFATPDGELPVLDGIDLERARRRDRRAARQVGLRQVDPAALHRRPDPAHRAARCSTAASRFVGTNPGVAHGLPDLRPAAVADRPAERRARPRGPRGAARRARPARARARSTSSASTASSPPTPRSSPAACASASASPARWSSNPTSCSWTSRSARSTCSPPRTCAASCSSCGQRGDFPTKADAHGHPQHRGGGAARRPGHRARHQPRSHQGRDRGRPRPPPRPARPGVRGARRPDLRDHDRPRGRGARRAGRTGADRTAPDARP